MFEEECSSVYYNKTVKINDFRLQNKTVKSMIHPAESRFGTIFSTKLIRLLKLANRKWFQFAPKAKWMNGNGSKKKRYHKTSKKIVCVRVCVCVYVTYSMNERNLYGGTKNTSCRKNHLIVATPLSLRISFSVPQRSPKIYKLRQILHFARDIRSFL